MSTSTIAPRPAPAVNFGEGENLFVVCSRMPHTLSGHAGVFAEYLGGQFFSQLVRRQLQDHGVELMRPEREDPSSISIFQCLCVFQVRNVFDAARAVQPIIQTNKLSAFFFTGYFSMTHRRWHALGPSRPPWDFDRYVTELFAEFPAEAARRIATINAYMESIGKKLPPTPPAHPET